MSLLEQAYEDYTLLDKVRTADGYGGFTTAWTESATIKGAMVFNSSIEGRKAEAMGVSSVYTLTTKKNVVLEYHDVIRRERERPARRGQHPEDHEGRAGHRVQDRHRSD